MGEKKGKGKAGGEKRASLVHRSNNGSGIFLHLHICRNIRNSSKTSIYGLRRSTWRPVPRFFSGRAFWAIWRVGNSRRRADNANGH